MVEMKFTDPLSELLGLMQSQKNPMHTVRSALFE